jgi:hypothetical protein
MPTSASPGRGGGDGAGAGQRCEVRGLVDNDRQIPQQRGIRSSDSLELTGLMALTRARGRTALARRTLVKHRYAAAIWVLLIEMAAQPKRCH